MYLPIRGWLHTTVNLNIKLATGPVPHSVLCDAGMIYIKIKRKKPQNDNLALAQTYYLLVHVGHLVHTDPELHPLLPGPVDALIHTIEHLQLHDDDRIQDIYL